MIKYSMKNTSGIESKRFGTEGLRLADIGRSLFGCNASMLDNYKEAEVNKIVANATLENFCLHSKHDEERD
jgi:hypothetical protein